jgi:hypothetical protein
MHSCANDDFVFVLFCSLAPTAIPTFIPTSANPSYIPTISYYYYNATLSPTNSSEPTSAQPSITPSSPHPTDATTFQPSKPTLVPTLVPFKLNNSAYIYMTATQVSQTQAYNHYRSDDDYVEYQRHSI